jgi:hypothetical protein
MFNPQEGGYIFKVQRPPKSDLDGAQELLLKLSNVFPLIGTIIQQFVSDIFL